MQELESENRRIRAHLDLVWRELLKILGSDSTRQMDSKRLVESVHAVGSIIRRHEEERESEREIRKRALNDAHNAVANYLLLWVKPAGRMIVPLKDVRQTLNQVYAGLF